MPNIDHAMGGRLPLFDPKQLDDTQKGLYEEINSKAVPWAESAGFSASHPDGRLIGPFNVILLSPEIAKSFLQLQAAEQEHTTLSERVRQVIILTVGCVWNADYELYAHAAVARQAGLPEMAIRALCTGGDVPELEPKEQLAKAITRQLTAEHAIDDQLYREAVAVFGTRGILDLIFLAGCYDIVSSMLNAFRVPAPNKTSYT